MVAPTIQQISDNIVAQIEASIAQTTPFLPKTFTRVIAKALAAVIVILYKYAGFISLQMFVSTASDQPTDINGRTITPLNEWGRLVGIGEPARATQAELAVAVSVTNQTGTLPAQSQLVNVTTGITYLTLTEIPLDAATKSVDVRAASDQTDTQGRGVQGNMANGESLSFANPLPNVQRDAVVTNTIVTAADAETTANYRQRILDKFQKRPQGGAAADYELWGEEPAGIVNVYPYTSDNPGQVDVFVEATPESSGNPDGIPTVSQLQEVLDSIEFDENGLATRRPLGALANAFAIVRVGFTVEVIGLLSDNSTALMASVTTGVEEYFLEREPHIAGLTPLPRRDRITRSAVSGVVEDIVSASGGIFTNVVLELATVPIEAYTLGIGEKSKADDVTFTN